MGLLEGQVGFVTGAGHGQGRHHAVRMAQEGADVLVCDICAPIPHVANTMATLEDLQETAQLIEKEGRRAVSAVADVRSLDQVKAAVAQGLEAFGHIDVVAANAGVFRPTPFLEISEEEYDAIVDTDLRGVWNTCQAVLPAMVERRQGGAIVITSSTAGLRGGVPYAHYVVAKHGVVGLMRALANEFAKHNIRVNTVHPTGVNNTFMTQESLVGEVMAAEPLFLQAATNMLQVGLVEPADISNAVIWLLSDQARYVTGIQLPVDAGNTNKP
jgi:SDR family mycofactocin-dependent oxidoreductase